MLQWSEARNLTIKWELTTKEVADTYAETHLLKGP
jgi:hypothetical protein